MLKYRYQVRYPLAGLTLHLEQLSPTSKMKNTLLRLIAAKKIIIHSSGGPQRVAERLISNLSEINVMLSNEIHWVLNVNSIESWESINTEQMNLILGPNIEFEKPHIKLKVENVSNSVILVPSEWVIAVLKKRLPWYRGKYLVWTSDLDLNFWKPARKKKKKHILIYRKNDDSNADFLRITSLCAEIGLQFKIVTYGTYSQYAFRKLLRRSIFAIWLGTTESQGIALLEAWATNVPTLVREHSQYFDEITNQAFVSSSAPYLTDKSGKFFDPSNINGQTLLDFLSLSSDLEPRSHVMESYSKTQTQKNLIEIFRELNS